MLLTFILFTSIASIATIAPVYKIRKLLARLFYIPIIGWIFSISYGLAVSWVLLTIFSFSSSTAGLSNLTATLIFSGWLYFEHKKLTNKRSKLA
ncbi:hypothetical protein BN990_04293 [Virgibacillus salexigens]|uniref:Uncharacterized protein n=2 Tax=Virgibacillus massiliensis TaxID=1462526 RepID=A0A024QHE5_9BACI|nr:hypothetical protein BN990_04293 [Virgibacillus massiliensis]